MYLKQLILTFAVIDLAFAEEFSVISTSRPPTCTETITKVLTKLEHIEKKNAELKNALMQKIEKLEEHVTEMETIGSPAANKALKTSTLPTDCLEVRNRGDNYTGIFLIQPKLSSRSFFARCDMSKRDGGWTLILNRSDGSTNFDQDWKSYKDGFGNLAGEFWLGLENIYHLSGQQVNELLVELVEGDQKHSYAHYKYFSLGNEDEGYRLKMLGGFTGDAENSLLYHASMKFSTKDKDQDDYGSNCAKEYTGGWWYKSCHTAHLTGQYSGNKNKYNGVHWGSKFNLKEARMLIRPRSGSISFP